MVKKEVGNFMCESRPLLQDYPQHKRAMQHGDNYIIERVTGQDEFCSDLELPVYQDFHLDVTSRDQTEM